MRTAICISGLSRGVLFCLPSIYQYFIKPLNADVFMHTWDIDVVDDGTANRFLGAPKVWDTVEQKMEYFEEEAERKGYKLVYSTDIYQTKSWNFLQANIKGSNVVPMSYSIYRANGLKKEEEKKENFKYDLVIRTRMDSLYENTVPSNEIKQVLSDPHKICVCSSLMDWGQKVTRNSFLYEQKPAISPFVADNFAFGNSAAMDIYSSLYSNLPELYKTWLMFKIEGNCPPECLLGLLLKERGILPFWSEMHFKRMIRWSGPAAIFESNYGITDRTRKSLQDENNFS